MVQAGTVHPALAEMPVGPTVWKVEAVAMIREPQVALRTAAVSRVVTTQVLNIPLMKTVRIGAPFSTEARLLICQQVLCTVMAAAEVVATLAVADLISPEEVEGPVILIIQSSRPITARGPATAARGSPML